MMRLIFRRKFIIPTLVIASLYLVTNTYLMNFRLLKMTLLGSYDFEYKVKLLTALLGGMWTAMSGFGLTMLIIIAVLTGANLTLIFKRVIEIHSFGKSGLFASFGSAFGFITSGCAACGLPILALLGLSSSAIYLPFQGAELSILSAGLLAISFYLMAKGELKSKVC